MAKGKQSQKVGSAGPKTASESITGLEPSHGPPCCGRVGASLPIVGSGSTPSTRAWRPAWRWR